MKKFFFLIAVSYGIVMQGYAQNIFPSTGSVGIGTTAPAASSILEVRSTTKGFLVPRMTAAQRAAIASPATGLLVYQTDGTAGYYYYYGTGWRLLLYSAASPSLNNLSTTTSVNRSLLTQVTATFDLGSVARKWRKGYFSDTVFARTLVVTDSTNTGVKALGGYYGVMGMSPANYGVYGQGGYIGLYGQGGAYGLYASGTTYGVYGYGSSSGVYGYGTTYGVYGYSYSGTGGVYGQGAYAIAVNGNSTNNYGGVFTSTSFHGIYAKTSSTAGNIYAAVFQGNTYSYGAYLTSDERVKKNISVVKSGMDLINQLQPKTYEFKRDGKYIHLNLPQGNQYGLLAQDVEKILPGLVGEAPLEIQAPEEATVQKPEAGKPIAQPEKPVERKIETMPVKAINYTALIPLMIKGMQELDTENKNLKQEIAALQQLVKDLSVKLNGANAAIAMNDASLQQNQPNPFNGKTIVPVNVPAGAKQATLAITETGSGKFLKAIVIKPGTTQLTLDANTLSNGSYTYTLNVDGKQIDSRQMTVIK